MSDPFEDFLSRWDGVDPLDGPASPARDLVLAAQFEDEVQNGGLAQFLWNRFPRWEAILDGAERAYRAMGAERQLSALPEIRAVLRENAPLCARRIELAKNETEPGQAFSVWYESAEERMGLPSEELFYPDEPTLAAARRAYLEANRAALGDGPQGRARGRRRLLRVLLPLLAILLLTTVWIPVYPIRTPPELERLFQEFRSDLKTGRYEEARALMTRRMKAQPAFSVHIRNSYPTLQEQLSFRDSWFLDRCRSNLFFTRCRALYVGESRFGIASSVYPVYTTVSFRKEKGRWMLDDVMYHNH